ncbi:MAG: FecR domain-containing protein [SAR202 cluster bacterium]|nr:FecR domain-containing protein [SAR202 cluster bacterium]
MRLRNRLITTGVWFGAILLALVACGSEAQTPEAIVTVQEIVNRVEVNGLNTETEEPTFVELELGQFLQTGNLVKTHENSSARVDISMQNFTRVSRTAPNTVWKLGRFALNGEAVIELTEGKIFVFDEDDGEEHWPLHIETPAGTASARGTWMAVEVNAETGAVAVQCLRGICEMENELGYQVFTNEQTVVATVDTVPTDPVAMKPEQVEEFHALPEVLTEEVAMPVMFTPGEAESKLDDAREAAVERKVQIEERKINAVLASNEDSGPGDNTPLVAAKPSNNDSEQDNTDEDSPPLSQARQNENRDNDERDDNRNRKDSESDADSSGRDIAQARKDDERDNDERKDKDRVSAADVSGRSIAQAQKDDGEDTEPNTRSAVSENKSNNGRQSAGFTEGSPSDSKSSDSKASGNDSPQSDSKASGNDSPSSDSKASDNDSPSSDSKASGNDSPSSDSKSSGNDSPSSTKTLKELGFTETETTTLTNQGQADEIASEVGSNGQGQGNSKKK